MGTEMANQDYVDENKLFDLPKAFPLKTVKMDRIRFKMLPS